MPAVENRVKKVSALTGHGGPVYCLEKGSSPMTVLSGGSDKHIVLWDINEKKPVAAIAKLPSIAYCIKHLPANGLLAIGTSTGGIHLVDLKAKKEVKFLKPGEKEIFDLNFSVLNNRFYATTGSGKLFVWSLDTFNFLDEIFIEEGKSRAVAINKTEDVLAVAGGMGGISLFDPSSLQLIKQIKAHGSSVNRICFGNNGREFYSGSKDAYLKKWSLESGIMKPDAAVPAHNFAIYDIRMYRDLLATASRDKTIKIWNPKSLKLLVRIGPPSMEGHAHSVNSICWMDHETLVSTGDDGKLLVWKIEL